MKLCRIGRKRSLFLSGCICALFSLVLLSVSIATNLWITTYERLNHLNGTLVVSVNSGLWQKCWTARLFIGMGPKKLWNQQMKVIADSTVKNCSIIAYFETKPKSIGELKAPGGILQEMQKTAFFQLIGYSVLLIGCFLSALSFCDAKLIKLIFVASGLYVFSGVSLLIGIVLYVGCVSQAFDGSDGEDEIKKYVYEFGISFYLTVLAFVLVEFSGVFYLYLFMASKKQFLQDNIHRIDEKKDALSNQKSENIRPSPDIHYPQIQLANNIPMHVLTSRSSLPKSNHTSPLSHNSYNPYRRNSEQQLLIKVHQINQSPYSSDVACIHWPNTNPIPQPQQPINHYLSSEYNPNQNLNPPAYTPAIRAHQPSPLIPFLPNASSPHKELILPPQYISSTYCPIIYSPTSNISYPNPIISPNNTNTNPIISQAIILNPSTYFDSPTVNYSNVTTVTSIIPSNACNNNHTLPSCNPQSDLIHSNTLPFSNKPRKITAI